MNALMSTPTAPVIPRQADTDDQVIPLWLKRYDSRHPRCTYQHTAAIFLAGVGKLLAPVTVGDLQAWAGLLRERGLAPATRTHRLAAIKSLLGTAHRFGYLLFNPSQVIQLPRAKRLLAEHILSEGDIHRVLALEPNPRNRALLTLLYVAGLRVLELCALRWRGVQPRAEAIMQRVLTELLPVEPLH